MSLNRLVSEGRHGGQLVLIITREFWIKVALFLRLLAPFFVLGILTGWLDELKFGGLIGSNFPTVGGGFLLLDQEVLLARPRVVSSEVSHAWDLPENTFGSAYAKFMGSRNFSPDDRPPVRFMDTDELAYVATRAREVHDFWHVLFGLPTNLTGESALKVVGFEQMLLPMCLLSVVGGSARFSEKQRALFFHHYFPWAMRAGMRCSDLMCLYYEKHFHENLEDVRKKWGILPCPDPKLQN